MGVVFAKPDPGDRIIAVARNSERTMGGEDEELPSAPDGPALDAAAGAGTDPDADPGDVAGDVADEGLDDDAL
jgi:DNA gyrase subunit A